MRPSPDSDALRLAFTRTEHAHAAQERRHASSSTAAASRSPTATGICTQLEVRYAGWDLSLVHLVDERTGKVLCRLYPAGQEPRTPAALRRALDPSSPQQRPCGAPRCEPAWRRCSRS